MSKEEELRRRLTESVALQAVVLEHLREARRCLQLAVDESRRQEAVWAQISKLEESLGWDDSMVDPISDLAPMLKTLDDAWEVSGEPVGKPISIQKTAERIWNNVNQ